MKKAALILLGTLSAALFLSWAAANAAGITITVKVAIQGDGQHYIAHYVLPPHQGKIVEQARWHFSDGLMVQGTEAWRVSENAEFPSVKVRAKLSDGTSAQASSDARPVRGDDGSSPGVRNTGTANADARSEAGPRLVVPQPGGFFALPGNITTLNGSSFPAVTGAYSGQPALRQRSSADGHVVYEGIQPGFYRIQVAGQSADYQLFVSPLPSRHLERLDMNWYLTQHNTETSSNCGPTVAAMAHQWATGKPLTVQEIRRRIGWQGSGAVSFEQLSIALTEGGVQSRVVSLQGPEDLFAIIDRGHLAGVLYDMAGLTYQENPMQSLFGQYYVDKGGHYLLVKGYSLDRRYLIIHDPIPSDWQVNRLRHPDGVSMLGENRYYPVKELYKALRQNLALEVFPNEQQEVE